MEEKEEELTDKTSCLTPSSISVVIPKGINNYDSNASSMVETIDKKKKKTMKKVVNATIKNKQSLTSRKKMANTSTETHRISNLTKTAGGTKAHLRELNDHTKIIKNLAKSLVSGASGSLRDDDSFRRTQQITSASSPKIKEGIPALMESPLLHDVKHIVNKVFRKRLQADLPGNKRKFFDDQHFREYLKHIEDIRRAEKNVMEVQERLLRNDKMVGDTELYYLNPNYVNKYSLIQLRAFDADGAGDEISHEESVGRCKKPVYGIHGELRRLRLRLNQERPQFERLCESRITDVAPEPLTCIVKKNGAFLRTNPSIIRFYDYEPGWIYSTTVDIQNTGNRIVSFKILPRKDFPNEFDFDYYPKGPLAPGMCSKITVNFNCRSYEDKFGLIWLVEEGNHFTNLFIMAENYKPILRYTIKTFDSLPGMYDKELNEEDLSEMFVFECHACLVGASKTIDVVVKNLGRSSMFICVSEDFWYLKAVEDLELDELRLESFVVTPSVFKIRYNESILLKVTFKPLVPSFHCAKMIIVSDNSCAQEVNIFGDGQSFDTKIFRLKGLGVEPATAQPETAMTRRYVLDVGEIGQVVRCVNVKNTRIKCPYRWVVNHSFDTSSSKEATVNFNVYPAKGMLNANSETEFQIMCSVTDTIVDQQLTGKYQVFVSLLIDDIPRASLTNDDGTVLKIANEANPELVTVQVVVLEVISEYKGKEYINLDVYPKIVDLNSYQYKLGDGMCVEETVNFKNKGKLPVTVSWIRPDEHSCVDNNCSHDYDSHSVVNFEVAPESLVVDDRAKVRVLIDPRGSGRLRHILRFRATNIDGSSDVVVYVRGLVEQPQVIVRPTTLPRLGILCAGTLATYRTEFTSGMNNFELITKRLYRFNGNDEETWQPHSEQSFGSCTEGIGVKNMIYMSINYETVVNTQTNGISCELTEWTFAECHNVYNQTVAVVKPPDVQFNQRIVSFHRPLYKGVTHRHKGICLFNNTRCGLTYCWGNPLETVANNVHCWLEPANGVVDGDSSVEFELVVIPKTAGLHNKFSVPCFIQNAAVPEQITVEFTAKGFGAQVSYVDSTQVYRKIQWPHDEEQWSDVNREDEPCDYENIEAEDFFSLDDTVLRMPPNQSFKFELFEENEFEPEDQEPAKWRSSEWQERDVLSAPLNSQIQDSKLYSRMSNHPIAFKDLQCNVVSRQQITIRNITDIPCRCLSSVKNFGLSAINNECRGDRILEPDEILELMKASNTHCVVWLDVVNSELAGQAEFILSVSALATVWGEYEDEVSIELHAGDDVLPAIRIPIAVLAVTYPVEFPLATPPGPVATASFSLYSMNTSIRLKIKNKSEMPIHVSWLLYNKGEANQPFSVVLDMLTPDFPDPWSFRIMPHYGSTSQYFKVDPITLVLEPNDADFVTFSLDRTKEMYVKRNSNNIVFGQAIGIVTAVKFPEKNCNRVTGFKMPPVTVELQSETRHSLQPNFLVREPNNVFQVQAVQIYRSPDSYHKVTRRFTLLNLLRYPATIFFEADKPFCISAVRTLRCGTRSGNAAIRVIYEDLIRVDIDAVVTVKNCITPKMPANGTSRKIVLSGCLYAKCIDSMTTPSIVSPFKVHIHFPVLKLSTKNINFGQIALRDTKSETVKLSSYSGEEPFLAYSGNDVFEISPTTGTVDVKLPVDLTVKFTPGSDVRYSHSILICTVIPMDLIVLEVCGTGVK